MADHQGVREHARRLHAGKHPGEPWTALSMAERAGWLAEARADLHLPRQPSRTDQGVLRRQAARLAQQGLILSCVPDNEHAPAVYDVTTTMGDRSRVPRAMLPYYLDGVAHGAYATTSVEHQAWRQS